MSTKPLEAAIASTRAVLAAVTPDQLNLPSPCESWKVSDVINHVVGAQYFFAAAMNGTPPAGESPDFSAGDYLAAFDEGAAISLAAFSAEGAMGRMVKLPFGEMPGVAWAGLAATDTFVHGWDVAKAAGQSTDLAPELAAGLLASSRQAIQPAFRGENGQAPFTAERTAPEGAPVADQLAAFLGRQV
jgi:uncharacterized protein (TIGR03086 family)